MADFDDELLNIYNDADARQKPVPTLPLDLTPEDEARNSLIEMAVRDLVAKLIWDDRKEDESLPRGAIESAILMDALQADQIVEWFRDELRKQLK